MALGFFLVFIRKENAMQSEYKHLTDKILALERYIEELEVRNKVIATKKTKQFLSHDPTELMRVGGYILYEHPTRGDEAPIYMVTPTGKLCNTGFYDLDDFDLDLCRELERDN